MMYGGGAWMAVLMVLIILVPVGLIALVASMGRERVGSSRAREILDERLVAGDISDDEYRSRLAVIEETRPSLRVRRPGVIIAIAASVVLLMILLVAVPLAMRGAGWTNGWGHMGGGHMWGGGRGNAPPTISGAKEIVVVGADFAFSPDRIDVIRNEAVNIVFENKGSVYHTLTIVGTGFEVTASPGQRVAGSLVIGAPGTYEVICAVPGHTEAGMKGSLVVR